MAYNKDRGDSPMRRRGPRRRKKVCAFCSDKEQRALTVAIKRARHVSLMPYTLD